MQATLGAMSAALCRHVPRLLWCLDNDKGGLTAGRSMAIMAGYC